MARDMNTAAIWSLETATIPMFHLPVMPTDRASMVLAAEWAGSLSTHSNEVVTIYRNGIRFIDSHVK